MRRPFVYPIVSGAQTGDTREGIDASVETHDSHCSYAIHDRQVNGIPGRELRMSLNDRLCSLDVGNLDGQYLIDYAESGIESRLDSVPSVDSDITM